MLLLVGVVEIESEKGISPLDFMP